MKNYLIVFFATLALIFTTSTTASAQDLDTSNMPKYVVLTVEDPGVLMSLFVYVQKRKKSPYKKELTALVDYLDEIKVRSVTDLLNIMDELGYDYVNAFTSEGVKEHHIESRVAYNTVFKKQD